LSDHSGCVAAGLAAVTLGANLLEVHVTLSREAFGPDVSSSLTTTELTNLVNGVRFIERAVARPVEKENAIAEAAEMRYMFGKSIVASRDLPTDHRLAASDLCVKKPAKGIPAARFDSVIGRRLIRGVAADSPIEERDLD
jgi:N-acetylneuraminate synthase